MDPPNRTHARKFMKRRRRMLRANATPAERKLWSMLRKRQLKGRKFRRQHSIGQYVVDFYCPDEHLVIELDGMSHEDPLRHAYDAERERFLGKQGIRIIRFENRLVFEDPERVVAAICRQFEEAPDAEEG